MRTDLNKTVRGNAFVDFLWNVGIFALVVVLAFLLYKRGKLDGFLPAEYASTKFFPTHVAVEHSSLQTVPEEAVAPDSHLEAPAAAEPVVEQAAEESPVAPTEPQAEATSEATPEAAPEATSDATPEPATEAAPAQ